MRDHFHELDLVPNDLAKKIVLELFNNISTHPLKSVEAFRNAALSPDAMFAITPVLAVEHEHQVNFMMSVIRETIAEGRMIDFGYIPSKLFGEESLRAREIFEANELPHPYESWIGISRWEGGLCGCFYAPYPNEPGKILAIEVYGIAAPGIPDALLVNDIMSIEITEEGTRIYPWATIDKSVETEELMRQRGGNLLDPLVTFLRFLSDASVPITNVPAPEKLNRQRVRQGKFAIPAHSRVETRDYVSLMQNHRPTGKNALGGHHASPVAHWRRAHQRHLPSGLVVPVRSSKVNWRNTEELHRMFYRAR